MTRRALACVAALLTILTARPAAADVLLQRFTLIVGANFGGADRPLLKYGESDAERFARVMTELGGVHADHNVILRQPKLRELLDGLEVLTKRVSDAARKGGSAARTEVIVYYSGHADEKGLLLGEDRFSYVSLRDRLDLIPADVRIAVLDACASGAFTRIKGGRARPPFLVDESTKMRGHAFLTSSAATEVAQESDRIRASYFTHYLVSGMRGAADLSGDGRITLNEAYQFAFAETLGRTVDSRGGAQHPSYDINMSGTGDVVMTDVRQLSATLVLTGDVEGRFFVRNAAKELIVEVYKPAGRTISLGVEPGEYEVRVEREKMALLAKVTVADGAQQMIDRQQFGPTTLEVTRTRGVPDVMTFSVTGRNRIDMRFGMWRTGSNTTSTGIDAASIAGGFRYTRYFRENLAATFTAEGGGSQLGTVAGPDGVFSGVSSVVSFPFGIRWNPLQFGRENDEVKPYVAFSAGPVLGDSSGSYVGRNRAVTSGLQTSATIGGFVGGGADIHIVRWFAIGADVGYNWMADFDQPVGAKKNYSGISAGINVGFLFGRGSGPKP